MDGVILIDLQSAGQHQVERDRVAEAEGQVKSLPRAIARHRCRRWTV